MKFIKVNLPERKHVIKQCGDKKGRPYRLYYKFTEFLESGIDIAKVSLDDEEYANRNSALSTWYASIKRFNMPIKVKCIDGDIYFIRKDMLQEEEP